MKIIVLTTPIRPIPTDYPPFGSLAIIQALRKQGYDPYFYDIDCLRPDFETVLAFNRDEEPDILAISAVVSTAYAYVKKLATAVRSMEFKTKIVLGGNLAASAELLHRFAKIDICVIGEGEKVMVNLVNYYSQVGIGENDFELLRQIPGITYLNKEDNFVLTGYETPIPAEELFDPDFSILEKYSNIDNFIADPFTREDFARDKRSYEPHRIGKKRSTVISAKGCVARCTFCHRWDKGYRQFPPEKIIKNIKYLIETYNVGFIQFGDENFGSNRKATEKLIELIKPLDILWQVGGVRSGSVNPELLRKMYNAGCTALYYGFETGSAKILEVMEKKLERENSINAAKWTYEAGLFTAYQLVLGMPGESSDTIAETIEMVKQITEYLSEEPYSRLSVNYIQALPGTPVYEFARSEGHIGLTLEDEDQYLESISDINASDDTKALNFTDYPFLYIRSWRPKLAWEITSHWLESDDKRLPVPETYISAKEIGNNFKDDSGYFNKLWRNSLRLNPVLIKFLKPIRVLPIWSWVIVSEFKRSPKKIFFSRVWELIKFFASNSKKQSSDEIMAVSLRKSMKGKNPKVGDGSLDHDHPLRLGR